MKVMKRSLALMMVLAVMLSVLVLPASALEPYWINYISSNFPVTKQTGYQPKYASVVQRFLIVSSSTEDYIADHGGVDGMFGPYTAAAVKIFQSSVSLNPDGQVGAQTWAAIANAMWEYDGSDNHQYSFARGYDPIIWVDEINNGNQANLYYITSDTDDTGTFLVTANTSG